MRSVNFNPVNQFREELDRLMTGAFSTPGVASAARFVTGRSFPALNVWEDGDNVFVEAEVAGMRSDDLEISVAGDELTIKGERLAADRPGAKYHRRERGAGSFARVVQLPSEVNPERVEAALTDGVLLLTLPKAEAVKPRKIKVNVGGKTESEHS